MEYGLVRVYGNKIDEFVALTQNKTIVRVYRDITQYMIADLIQAVGVTVHNVPSMSYSEFKKTYNQ